MSCLIDDHAKWLHAFNWWFHSASRDRIIANLREGVPLSPKNSMFLAAVIDGTAKPLTGKQTGLARFKNSIIDNTIHDLRNRGFDREKIRGELQRKGINDRANLNGTTTANLSITGVNKRIDRLSSNPSADYVQKHAELEKNFYELYGKVTA